MNQQLEEEEFEMGRENLELYSWRHEAEATWLAERSYAEHEAEACLAESLAKLGSTQEEYEAVSAFAKAFDCLFIVPHLPTPDDEILF